jgi:hypothetical protein
MDEATTSPPPTEAGPWEIGPNARRILPAVLAQMAADKLQAPKDRIAAALALVQMNEQNLRIGRTAKPAPPQPAIRLEVSAEGVDAIRANLLGRLVATGLPGPAAATPTAD